MEPATCRDLSILIVGYDSSSYLAGCLGSIAGSISDHSYEILFVNNGTDGSENLVRSAFPQVRVLESLGNIGFAAGNDYLADHAHGRWLLLLNPDTRLYPGALDALLDTAALHSEYEVLGGVTMTGEGEPQMLSRLELPSFFTLLRALVIGAARPTLFQPASELLEVEALNGGFMMVRRDCWARLDGFDRDFFLYAEELDFFKRLKDAGGQAAQVVNSRMFHDFGSGDVFSPGRIRFLTTGNAHYFHKHFAPPYAYACVFLMWVIALKRYLGGAILGARSSRYARMSRGFAQVAKAPWTWMRGYNSAGADPRKSF